MLKKLVIVVLLLGFAALDHVCKAQPEPKAANDQNPSSSVALPAAQQGYSPSLQQSGPADQGTYEPKSVRVILPPKDNYDLWTFWISVTLAAVGIAGIVVGVWTLRFLAQQAGEMRQQRILMRRTLNTIRRQTDQMAGQLQEMRKVSDIENKTLILQFRPHVVMRNTIAKEFTDASRCVLKFQIANIGGSAAYIVGGNMSLLFARLDASGKALLTESGPGEFDERILHPGQREDFEDVLTTDGINSAMWEKFQTGDRSSIYLMGTVWYKDDLSIPRKTGIYRKYDPKTGRFEPQQNSEEEYTD